MASKKGFLAYFSMPKRLALAGLLITSTGAGLAFSLGDSYGPGNRLAYLAFCLAAIGITVGFAGSIWVGINTISGARDRAKAKREQYEKEREKALWQHDFTRDG